MNTEIPTLLNLFSVGQTYTTIYFREHPRVRESTVEFAQHLDAYLRQTDEDRLFLGVINGRVVAEGSVLLGPTLISHRYIEAAEQLKCGGFQFLRGLASGELVELFMALRELSSEAQSLEQAQRILETRGVKHIQISPPCGDPGWLGEGDPAGETDGEEQSEDIDNVLGLFRGLIGAVEVSHGLACEDRDLDARNARQAVDHILNSVEENAADLLQLASYPDYDSYTIGHSVRVALFSLMLGHELGIPRTDLLELGTAALLHDVGKSRIPPEILYKPGKLNEEEWSIMQQHAWYGAEALLETEESGPYSVGAAFGHHLRYDRMGYPSVPDWVQMGHATSLIQVCDVFEALTAIRPYKPSLTPSESYRIMIRNQGAFHPTLLQILIRSLGFFPPGSKVQLNSDELAVVTKAGAQPDRPIVHVTHNSMGIAFARGDRREIDLGDEGQAHHYITHLWMGDQSVVKYREGGEVTTPREVTADLGLTSGSET